MKQSVGFVIVTLATLTILLYVFYSLLTFQGGLPKKAKRNLNIYTAYFYGSGVDIIDDQRADDIPGYAEVWCVTSEPIGRGRLTYWKVLRIGEFTWDVQPSSASEFIEMNCDP